MFVHHLQSDGLNNILHGRATAGAKTNMLIVLSGIVGGRQMAFTGGASRDGDRRPAAAAGDAADDAPLDIPNVSSRLQRFNLFATTVP